MNDEKLIAGRIVQLLDENLDHLDRETAERLVSARRSAVAAMRPSASHVPQAVLVGWGRLVDASNHGGYRFWLPVLILLAMLAALVSSNLPGRNQPVDVDTQLLASELPPEVYADKEFVAWLEHASQP